MKIHEFQARQLLEQYGIPDSAGQVVFEASQARAAFLTFAGPTCIAKVQVLMGGRGKAGGVMRIKNAVEAEAFAEKFLGKPFSTAQSAGESKTVRSILFTEDKVIREEYYLGITIDRSHRTPVILFSKQGGMEIEEVVARNPEAILKSYFIPGQLPSAGDLVNVFKRQISDERISRQIAEIALKLAKLFVEKDLSLCEINPLALTEPNLVLALDAKIVFDDNALFRHEDIAALKDPEEEDDREKKAKQFGLSYVSMGGNVGCLVNGAGLAMATMDMIKLAGGEPANFLDVGGSATTEAVREGFKIILQDSRVEAILVNIFGGIMKCDVVADGVIQASRQTQLQVPLIVRLEGTRVAEGRALLQTSGLKIISCSTIQEAAQAAVREAQNNRNAHVRSY
jgi:succinyl-CoA synthetase beta subunit